MNIEHFLTFSRILLLACNMKSQKQSTIGGGPISDFLCFAFDIKMVEAKMLDWAKLNIFQFYGGWTKVPLGL